jgi:pimeloyl-ACP methyl ester carboxylesterase
MIKIEIENLIFDCRESGNEEDELVILLHGFPESSFMYRELMKDLSDLGYYCMAPNMRGYSPGVRPSGKSNYTIDTVSNDIMDLANYVGREKFHLIDHDWDSVIGWQIVHDNPDAIVSWTGL